MTNPFVETHMVLVDFRGKLGRTFMEVDPGYSFKACVNDIISGQFGSDDTRILGVYRVGFGIPTEDVSEKACEEIKKILIAKGDTPIHQVAQFMSENGVEMPEEDDKEPFHVYAQKHLSPVLL